MYLNHNLRNESFTLRKLATKFAITNLQQSGQVVLRGKSLKCGFRTDLEAKKYKIGMNQHHKERQLSKDKLQILKNCIYRLSK